MVLELAESVEAAARDADSENGTAGLNQRSPGTLICAARVRVETISDDCVASGPQHDRQTFSDWGEPRSIMHQSRLECSVILKASGIVEEWIGCSGWIEKLLVAANGSLSIEPHDAHVS